MAPLAATLLALAAVFAAWCFIDAVIDARQQARELRKLETDFDREHLGVVVDIETGRARRETPKGAA